MITFFTSRIQHCLILGCFLLTGLSITAQISGTVYEELPVNGSTLNTYGVLDGNELGVEGVMVTITDASGTVTNQITTSVGTWSDPVSNFPVRVEFTWPNHPWLESSPHGSASSTSVQFVDASNSNVNFGLHDPEGFSDTAMPPIYVPSWRNGLSSGSSEPAMYSFVYTEDGQNPDEFSNGRPAGTADVIITQDEIGTTWGIAYQKDEDRLFTSSVIRRHSDLGDGTGFIYVIDGPSGSNPLYKFDLNGIATASGGTIDLGTVCRGGGCENDPGNTGDAGDYELGGLSSPNYDIDAAAKIGKVSFGDIDIQPGTDFLWAVNLNQKALVKIDISSSTTTSLPGTIDQYLISSISGLPSCTNGEIRPWALKFAKGKGFLGVVCDAEQGGDASDLAGYILSFDPNNPGSGFTTELTIPTFDFLRDNTNNNFRPWTNDWADFSNPFGSRWLAPQPIISDIEFDEAGDMIVAVIDRSGFQLGSINRTLDLNSSRLVDGESLGDIYHACYVSGTYIMENGSSGCDYNYSFSDQGFDAQGEFFNDVSADGFDESAQGALAILKGSGTIASTVMDPHPEGVTNDSDFWNSNGVNFYDPMDGSISRYYSLNYTKDVAEFGKAAGLGDIEILTPPAPVEIGNFVWNDTDNDGEQDPGEAGISGVAVELYDAAGSALLATATTDVNGNYIFSNDPNGTSTASHIYNIISLETGMDYIVRFPTTSGALSLTSVDATGNTLDSDANTTTGDASVSAAEIPISGANNHTFDAGYSMAVNCSSSVTASPGTCNPNTNTYTLTGEVTFSNDPGTGTIMVEVDGQTNVINLPTTSPASYTITGLTADGSSHTVTVTFSDDASCGSTTTYTAPASCTPNCSVSQTHSTECNDNGTSSMADDFFNLTVTGTVVNGSGSYIVTVNVYTSPSTASGSNVTIQGDGTHTNLAADGNSTYTVMVMDAVDNSCVTSFNVGPVAPCSNCPSPNCLNVQVEISDN